MGCLGGDFTTGGLPREAELFEAVQDLQQARDAAPHLFALLPERAQLGFGRFPVAADLGGGGTRRLFQGGEALLGLLKLAAHAAGDPVILFPFRYWDRWADRADAPELAYFRLALRQPAAFWRTVFWDEEQPSSGGCAIEVLQRTDPAVPWDADPESTPQLKLLVRGMHKEEANPIGVQRDSAEWRAFVRYAPHAFDASTGLSHAWKQTPRLRLFGVEYLAPYISLRGVDR